MSAEGANLGSVLARCLLAVAMAALPAVSTAEVTQSGPGGFSVRHVLETAADTDTVYAQMGRVGEWWNPDHSWSGKAENLVLDPERRCFCENLPNGGVVEHLRIVYLAPGEAIRFDGALGPLQSMPASGRMEWKIEGVEAGSRVSFTYHVFGNPAAGLEHISPAVDGVIGEQLARLGARLAAD